MAPQRPGADAEPPATLGPGGSTALVVFLLFLGFPLADLLGDPPSAPHLVLVVAGVAAFVAVYLRVMLAPRGGRDTLVSLGAMAVLGLAVSLGDRAEWATTFIYVAAVCGFRLAPPGAQLGIAAAAVTTGALSLARGYPTDDAATYVLYAVGIGAMLRGYARTLAVNRELHIARGEIARLAVGDERLRFARDLHDLLGHSLSLIALKSELARRLIATDPDGAAREVCDIEQVSREALVEVREAVGDYRRMTLTTELRGAEAALQAAGIQHDVIEAAVSFPPETEAVLAWAVREGTTNVIRHSRARHCAIRVHAALTDAGVEIVDDGTATDATDGGGGGTGLIGLEERVRRRHGSFLAGHRPEGGFRLAVEVPARS